jgi:signal transduction histidine kinase
MTATVLDDGVGSTTVNLPILAEPNTYFAPAGRDTLNELRRKVRVVANEPFLRQTLDAMPSMVAILSDTRQIVSANGTLLTVLNATVCQTLGRRPGEAVGCIRAKEGPDGCGTAKHCMTCGAVNAILESQDRREKVVRECRILINTPAGVAPLDVRVTATPLAIGADRFIVVAIEDISQSNRLAVLQRIFFHDVLNTAGCIQGYAQFLADEMSDNQDVCQRMIQLSDSLIEAIAAQRDLMHAEAGDLQPRPVAIRASQVLDEIRAQYQKHPLAEGRAIEVRHAWDGSIVADRQILLRVLGNMVKNALEATSPKNTVSIDCREERDEVVFTVHNPEVMSEEVQLQIFQRSFSTKDQPGRGIGTHSIKLLGERYLAGRVGFDSQPSTGTTIWLAIPRTSAT